MRRKTTEGFITQAKQIHGDRYDYSLVEYKDANTKVLINCPKHGQFSQKPAIHLTGCKCPDCSDEAQVTLDTKTFIQKAIGVHANYYDYSESACLGYKTKVKIICLIHGQFTQLALTHLHGGGCPECGKNKKSQKMSLGQEEFLKRAKETHGDLYDYSLVKYLRQYDKIKIACKVHGVFEQVAKNHLNGYQCPKCGLLKRAKTQSSTTEEFVRKSIEVHGTIYDYSLVRYLNSTTKVKIICQNHGIFYQTPSQHLSGAKCKKCANELSGDARRMDTIEFLQRAKNTHHDLYSYRLVEYRGYHIPVTIICYKHGAFNQAPSFHLSGKGCPICSYSKGENLIANFLKSMEIKFERQKKFSKCRLKKPLPFDFYFRLDNKTFLIEYDGKFHFEFPEKWGGQVSLDNTKLRDSIKTNFAESNGFILIRIPYTEMNLLAYLYSELSQYLTIPLNDTLTSKTRTSFYILPMVGEQLSFDI